jgi:hypothetical protein
MACSGAFGVGMISDRVARGLHIAEQRYTARQLWVQELKRRLQISHTWLSPSLD